MSQLIQAGHTQKTQRTLTIQFPQPYASEPEVVVAPFWSNQNDEVGHVETINDIDTSEFTVVSGNAASNYFVSWVAVGEIAD